MSVEERAGAPNRAASEVTHRPWREPVDRAASRATQAGLSSIHLLAAALACGLLAFWLMWMGLHWPGLIAAAAFAFLRSVVAAMGRTKRRKRASATLDRLVDLLGVPLLGWAWAHGLAPAGTPLEPVYALMLVVAIAAGHAAQHVIRWRFRQRFGLPMHDWQPFDARYRMAAAGPGPDLAILLAALLFGRPDVGLELVALWTLLSVIVEAVRLAQANALRDAGGLVRSRRR